MTTGEHTDTRRWREKGLRSTRLRARCSRHGKRNWNHLTDVFVDIDGKLHSLFVINKWRISFSLNELLDLLSQDKLGPSFALSNLDNVDFED